MKIEKLLEIKEKIAKSIQEKAKLEGKVEEIEKRLNDDYGYKSVRHAIRDITKMDSEIELLESQFSDKCAFIESTYKDLEV